MSVRELVEQLERALTAVRKARSCLASACTALAEAREIWGSVTAGTSDPEAGQLVPLAESACNQIEELAAPLDGATNLLASYAGKLGADGPPPADSTGRLHPATASPRAPDASRRDLVERLRSELPPPVTQKGQKTHGRWFAPGTDVEPVVSGVDERTARVNEVLRDMGCPTLPVTTAADVELKLAARMRDQGIRDVTLIINNTPCPGRLGCDRLLPVILPRGYSLTVVTPEGQKRYVGGAKPWWS